MIAIVTPNSFTSGSVGYEADGLSSRLSMNINDDLYNTRPVHLFLLLCDARNHSVIQLTEAAF